MSKSPQRQMDDKLAEVWGSSSSDTETPIVVTRFSRRPEPAAGAKDVNLVKIQREVRERLFADKGDIES